MRLRPVGAVSGVVGALSLALQASLWEVEEVSKGDEGRERRSDCCSSSIATVGGIGCR